MVHVCVCAYARERASGWVWIWLCVHEALARAGELEATLFWLCLLTALKQAMSYNWTSYKMWIRIETENERT